MIGNYWNSAYRNLMKRKGFSFINVFGLAVGMASALLILTYVTFEFSFDKMHQKYERIFRVESTFYEGEVQTDYWASSSFGYGSAMKENLAGIEDYTRVVSLYQPEQIVKYGELTLRENQIAYADPGFFHLPFHAPPGGHHRTYCPEVFSGRRPHRKDTYLYGTV